LGSIDFINAIAAIDSSYLESPKAAWVMNRRTIAAVAGIVDKMGNLLNLVQYAGKKPYILGVPVKISPSMDDISISNTPVLGG
jgi:HK97 family phage major capsid protein